MVTGEQLKARAEQLHEEWQKCQRQSQQYHEQGLRIHGALVLVQELLKGQAPVFEASAVEAVEIP
jgi:hypothetical protein